MDLGSVKRVAKDIAQKIDDGVDKTKELAGATGDKIKELAVVAGDKTKELAVAAGDKTKELAMATGGKMKELAVATGDKTKELAVVTGDKAKELHEKYVSKVVPDCGKFGRWAAELAPGVGEYNAIREGDWTGFAIEAGIDLTALGVGLVTAGAGAPAVKGGAAVVKPVGKIAAKTIVKESAERVAKEAAKETAEKGAKAATKEVAEKGAKEGAEKGAKETAEKEAKESGNEIGTRNKLDGIRREEEVLEELLKKDADEGTKTLREVLLRDSNGNPIKDPLTNEARRIDFVRTKEGKVVQSIEVTSETAQKAAQTAKELRILEEARKSGGAFIKDPETGELIEFGEDIATEIWRLP